VGVAPSRLAFDLEPSERRSFTLNYYNNGAESLQVRVYPMDYLRRPDGTVLYLEPADRLSGSGWIEVQPASFVAPPRSRNPVQVTVEVPEDTPDGEYHAVVFMEALPATEEGTLRLGARVGSVLYMAVGTQFVRAAALVPYGRAVHPVPHGQGLERLLHLVRERLRAITVGRRHVPLVVTGRPFVIFVPIANLGNVHIRPEVTVKVARGGGEPRVLRHLGEVILAADAKIIELRWQDPPFLGLVRVEVQVDYGGPEPLRAAVTSLVFPLDLLFGLGLLAAGLRLFGVRGISLRMETRRMKRGSSRAPPR